MKFISLFSGIGGFDLALENAGMKCIAQVEIDKSCLRLLESKWSKVRRFTDVKECGRHNLSTTADLICGGFPCQDLSVAGKRAGLAGERSGLWWEFARIIDELNPKWFIIENVFGLLSSNNGKDFAIILRWMAERGYGVAWRVLDSKYFGVPQRRRRVFIVGHFADGRAAEILFEPEGSDRDIAPSGEEGESPSAYAIRRAQTGSNGWGIDTIAHTLDETGGDSVATQVGALQARDYKGVGTQYAEENKLVVEEDPLMFTVRCGKDGGGKGYLGSVDQAMTVGGNTQYLAEPPTVGALQARDSKGIGSTIDDKLIPVAVGHSGGATLKINEEVNTLNAQTDSETTAMFNGVCETNNQDTERHPYVGIRRLTPIECERLQGFPDGWTDGFSDSTRYRMLGNAVTVPVVEWIAKRIMENEKNGH